MNFRVSILDFFGFSVPGVAFLGILYYFYYSYNPDTQLSQVTAVGSPLALIIVASTGYLMGHILQILASFLFFSVVNLSDLMEDRFQAVKKANPNIKIKFKPSQVFVIKAIIRKQHPESLVEIDSYNAMWLMMSKISMILFVVFIFEIQFSITQEFSLSRFSLGIVSGAISVAAFYRCKELFGTMFKILFSTAVGFGLKMEQFVELQEK